MDRAAHGKKFYICLFGILAGVAVGVGILCAFLFGGSEPVETTPTVPTTAPTVPVSTTAATETTVATEPPLAGRLTDWNLLLVNPWHPMPEDFTVELAALDGTHSVDQRIVDDLQAMIADANACGLYPIICSSYRTQEAQEWLYENRVQRCLNDGLSQEEAVTEAGRWVAVPGTSEHQLGLALDIVSADYRILDREQENTAEQKWLMENSWHYGFILRYPTDKTELTGIYYEPWHYRYVGREVAEEIYRLDCCLEEYLALLS